MKVRIHYHHTDCGGVVYYATYLEFLEEARTDFLAGLGMSVRDLKEQGVQFVVTRQEIDYKCPAFYGDELDVRTWISAFTGVRLVFDYELKNQGGRIVAKARTALACVNRRLEPESPPREVAAALAAAVTP